MKLGILEYTLLSVFLTTNIAGSSVAPVLPGMALYFSNSEEVTKLFLIIPSFVVFPFILFSGFLLKIWSKKKLILFGLSLYVISTVLSFSTSDYIFLLFYRSLTGIGAGLVIPYATSLIADYYTEQEKDTMIAHAGVVGFGGSVVILFLTGLLASINWRLGLLPPLISLLPIYLVYRNITPKNQLKSHKYPFIFNLIFKKEIFIVSFIYFLVVVLMFQYFASISFLIINLGLGGAFKAGIAQSCFFLAGIISNLLMRVIKNISSSLLHSFQMMFIAQGFFTLGSADINFMTVCFASFLIGVGYGSFGSSMAVMISGYTTKINRVHSISILIGAMYMGQSFSPVFFSYFSSIFNMHNYSDIFLIEAIVFIIIAMGLFARFLSKNFRIISLNEIKK